LVKFGFRQRLAEAETAALYSQGREIEIPLGEIKPRANPDTRPVTAAHIIRIARTLSEQPMLAPIVLDKEHRLVAGSHRLIACRLLEIQPDLRASRWEEIAQNVAISPADLTLLAQLPHVERKAKTLVLPFDSAEDVKNALILEIAENEIRLPYSKSDCEALAARLSNAGFRVGAGRPKKGEVPRNQVLASILGKSRGTVTRLMQQIEGAPPSTRASKPKPTANQNLINSQVEWLNRHEEHPLREKVQELLDMLRKCTDEDASLQPS